MTDILLALRAILNAKRYKAKFSMATDPWIVINVKQSTLAMADEAIANIDPKYQPAVKPKKENTEASQSDEKLAARGYFVRAAKEYFNSDRTHVLPEARRAQEHILQWLDRHFDYPSAAEFRASQAGGQAVPENECTCAAKDMPFSRYCKVAYQAACGWGEAANWVRNNYQDHTNIADLCSAMLTASPKPPAVQCSHLNQESARSPKMGAVQVCKDCGMLVPPAGQEGVK